MIRVTQLTKFFGTQLLFDDVTFQIHPGEKLGLVGRNGYGKTTLLRMLQGEVLPDEGEISFPEGHRIGTLDQHLNIDAPTVLDAAAAGLSEEDKNDRWKAEKLLSGLGFSVMDFDRPPSEFSGGFQMRIALVKLLLSEPDLLLLDEPTNYLDITSLRWLEKFLKNWKGEFVLITHDRKFIDAVCTHTLAIHRTGLKKIRGGCKHMFQQIALEEEVHERTRKNAEKQRNKTEKFIREFRAGARSAGLVQSRIKMLEKQRELHKLDPIPDIHFKFESRKFEADRMLQASSLSFGYTPDDILFSGIDLHLSPGDRVGVIGANGRGKSTFLRLLSGEVAPLSGTVKPHQSLRSGMFVQGHESSFDKTRTVVEELHSVAPELPEQAIFNLSGTLMFSGDAMHKKIEILSGGERARVSLGKLMIQPHDILLLDEPTNHLDLESVDALIEALDAFPGAIIFVSHNEKLLEQLATQLVVFDDGGATVHNETYTEFLKTTGWSTEGEVVQKEKKAPGSAAQIREQKKQLQRELRPLEKALAKQETLVLKLEEELEQNKDALNTAKRKGSHLLIDECQTNNWKLQEKISESFEKMVELEQDIVAVKERFPAL
jgi:ATP-binding cassette subfamily F protein 3